MSLSLLGVKSGEFLHEFSLARAADLEHLVAEFRVVHYDLDIMYGRAIVQGDEAYVFVAPPGTHPAFDVHIRAEVGPLQRIGNNRSFHIFYNNAD